jgi:hypothetical protein
MKCLFVTSKAPDHLACCIWDGLQEVLGEENVVDAVGCDWLHASTAGDSATERCVPGGRGGSILGKVYKDFDFLVVHSCFNRDHNWNWCLMWQNYLRSGGKVAYVEGWDAAWQIEPPGMKFDAVFRKEIKPGVEYPYVPIPLGFAAPERWFRHGSLEDGHRAYDVCFIGSPETCHPNDPDLRWRALKNLFRTRRKHHSVVATHYLGFEEYYGTLRRSKLALCPAAADGADSLRTYEAVACGAVPIFVGYPNHVRDPWFPNELVYQCSVEDLPEHVDEALSHDLTEKRKALVEWGKKHHTTRARAEKVLKLVFGDSP